MSAGTTSRSDVHLGTVVSMAVADHPRAHAALDAAFRWFREVEAQCSRFDPESDLMRLCRHVATPVAVPDLLFEAIRFAVEMAARTDGAFDPTIGHLMEARGFNRSHRSGEVIRSGMDAPLDVSYRDVECDANGRTITLHRPLVLDLGAVAKGLAIDLAARELMPFKDFVVDAGGDLYCGGTNSSGAPWTVGIRHPRIDGEVIDVLLASDQAVCTSGDYERRTAEGHHILDPRAPHQLSMVASATVVASSAMLADAAATAAFVLGLDDGVAFCEGLGVEALLISSDLSRRETPGLHRQ